MGVVWAASFSYMFAQIQKLWSLSFVRNTWRPSYRWSSRTRLATMNHLVRHFHAKEIKEYHSEGAKRISSIFLRAINGGGNGWPWLIHSILHEEKQQENALLYNLRITRKSTYKLRQSMRLTLFARKRVYVYFAKQAEAKSSSKLSV